MFLQHIILLPGVLHHQGHHSLHMVSKPVPSLSADGTQALDVGPGGGGTAGLAPLHHQHVNQLDVESLVTAHDQVPQADDGTLPDSQPGALLLWSQSFH